MDLLALHLLLRPWPRTRAALTQQYAPSEALGETPMKSLCHVALFVLGCTSLLPATALADRPETHDGLMLRLTLGFGWGSNDSSGNYLYYGSTTSGNGGSFSLDVGATVMDNLIIHGRLASFVLIEPEYDSDGYSSSYEIEDYNLNVAFLGPAATLYFGPNMYFTGALGLCRLSGEYDGDETFDVDGVGVNLDFGKEWWVSERWGLGVAGRLWLATFEEDDIENEFVGLAVLFSATYQ